MLAGDLQDTRETSTISPEGSTYMIRRFILTGVAALTLALASSAVAQDRATLVLRSGERISGDLVDLGGVGFTVMVNGQKRTYKKGEVARIEFSGDATLPQGAQVPAGQSAVVLTNGSVVTGSLYDISGKAPLKITLDTPSGQRELSSNQIRAIHFVRPSNGSIGTGGGGSSIGEPGGAGILVPANQRWIDTGITVREGQQVSFNARGEVQLSADSSDKANPSGSLKGRKGVGPLPGELAGALIGRVGPMAPFGVGMTAMNVRMPASGRLFLGINDDEVGDNQGGFRVQVTPQGNR
jgi:hypothetical protein